MKKSESEIQNGLREKDGIKNSPFQKRLCQKGP